MERNAARTRPGTVRLLTLAATTAMAMAMALILAVASTAAAAAPEFKPASGRYTAKGGAGTLKFGAEVITCEKDEDVGSIASAKLVGPSTIHFLGCETAGATKSGCALNSVGASAGLIVTSTVHGVLGTILPGGRPGLLILPTAGKLFTTLAKNECTKEGKVEGSIAAPITTDKSRTAKLTFARSNNKQEVREIDLEGASGVTEPELTAFSVSATIENTQEFTWAAETEVT
jgi:hypothetical protein